MSVALLVGSKLLPFEGNSIRKTKQIGQKDYTLTKGLHFKAAILNNLVREAEHKTTTTTTKKKKFSWYADETV